VREALVIGLYAIRRKYALSEFGPRRQHISPCILPSHTAYAQKKPSALPFFGIVVFPLPCCNHSVAYLGKYSTARHSDTHGVTQANRRRGNCRGRYGVGGSWNNTNTVVTGAVQKSKRGH
jgi:hypothetical protein